MRILFAGSEEARLSGGMIMAILLGNAIQELGHEVEYLAEEPAGEWTGVRFPLREGRLDRADDLSDVDAVITGFDGVEAALGAGAPTVAHFCAGYESHLWPARREDFERAYRLPTVKLVIAPHLRDTLRRELGVESVVVGAPIDLASFSPAARGSEAGAHPLRVLTVGPEPDGPYAPVPFKGIADVLEIVARARGAGQDFELVRLTPREDSLIGSELVDELHVGVAPAHVPEIYRSCDIYLGGSTAAEGLGMPAIEAACSGLALVLPEIPSFLEIPELAAGALLYPSGDVAAGAVRLRELLADPLAAQRLAALARRPELVARFSPATVGARIVAALEAAVGSR